MEAAAKFLQKCAPSLRKMHLHSCWYLAETVSRLSDSPLVRKKGITTTERKQATNKMLPKGGMKRLLIQGISPIHSLKA